MDPKFHPAVSAIMSGDIDRLVFLLKQDPSLATAKSSKSHPTLLQCLTLDAVDLNNKIEMAKVFIDLGADINGALDAAASIGNLEIAALVLDCGADVNGTRTWSPLEEALYWNNENVIELLLSRGASVHNLRIAAGLGRVDLIESFFHSDGSLKPEAGTINWPFGDPQKSNLDCKIKEELGAKRAEWSDNPQDVLNNAFVYACMHNQIEAARCLLKEGAEINMIPPGFDYSGTGLHYAALNGHEQMIDFLIKQGANTNIKDTKVNSTPAAWAAHGGHLGLRDHLSELQAQQLASEF